MIGSIDDVRFSVKGYLINPQYPIDNEEKYIFEPIKDVYKLVDECKKYAYLYPGGGTMLISNHKVVKMKSGYQVSFKRPLNELDLLPEETDEISNWIIRLTGSRLYAGFWGGSSENDPPDTEPSFWCKDLDVAKMIAKLFNQYSILDWKHINNDGLREIRNLYFEEGRKLDKEKILSFIRKENYNGINC